MKDQQILLSERHKIHPREQIRGRKYCKVHSTFVHHTNCGVHFRDTIQKAIEEGRLVFEDKPKAAMKVDEDPFQASIN